MKLFRTFVLICALAGIGSELALASCNVTEQIVAIERETQKGIAILDSMLPYASSCGGGLSVVKTNLELGKTILSFSLAEIFANRPNRQNRMDGSKLRATLGGIIARLEGADRTLRENYSGAIGAIDSGYGNGPGCGAREMQRTKDGLSALLAMVPGGIRLLRSLESCL